MSGNAGRYRLDDLFFDESVRQHFDFDYTRGLRNALKKLTKSEILAGDFANFSERVPEFSDSRRFTKNQLIDFVLLSAKESNVDLRELLFAVELLYFQTHKNSRLWNAVTIKNPRYMIEKSTQPFKLEKRIMKFFKRSRHFCSVRCQFYQGAMWTLISIHRKQLKPHICLLMYPQLPFFLHTYVNQHDAESLYRVIVQLFLGTSCEILPISSRNVETVVLYSCQFLKENVPYQIAHTEREVSEQESIRNRNIINNDTKKERELQSYLKTTFDSKIAAPVESVTYNVRCNFHSDSAISVKCKSIFKGKNIVEGFHDFVKMEAATYPLPSYEIHVGTVYGNRISLGIE